MNSIVRASSTILAIAVSCAAAANSKCGDVDIPVIFSISSTYQDPSTLVTYNAGIRSDGGGDYVNGQSGVIAMIHVCNGSNGATLNTGTQRTVTYDFRNAVATNTSTPSWTTAPVPGGNLTFSNLLYNYNAAVTYSFTTYLKYADVQGFNFAMENLSATAPFNPPDGGVNSPCITSLVQVVHYPATSTTKETWIVWSDSATPANCSLTCSPLQVGTLFSSGRSE